VTGSPSLGDPAQGPQYHSSLRWNCPFESITASVQRIKQDFNMLYRRWAGAGITFSTETQVVNGQPGKLPTASSPLSASNGLRHAPARHRVDHPGG